MSDKKMTKNSKNERPQISKTVFLVIVKVGILFGLFYLCNTFALPIGLIGSIFLLVFSVYFTITNFNDLDFASNRFEFNKAEILHTRSPNKAAPDSFVKPLSEAML
jgi:hypothetical protein